jgi:aryl-alcohol dehydrogenase-like predicted oxidoreductase
MAGLALAWLLALPEITAVVIGPNNAGHLAPAREAIGIELSGAERDVITELFG